MDSKRCRILVTSGDPDGIGWEVAAKALNALGPKRDVQFTVYRHAKHAKLPPRIRGFKVKSVATLAEARTLDFDSRVLIEIRSQKPAALWVEEAARACLKKEYSGLVTAPLSKTSIVASGLKDIGHTEILARVSGVKTLFMGFVGRKFSVVLATGHQPLRVAAGQISPETLKAALRAAAQMRSILTAKKRTLPLAVVGLNPHAGEQGLIGNEEVWFKTVMEPLASELGPLAGPLVPDAAFQPSNWDRYSVYICPYHDQGLIPFKLVHGFKGGVHLTLGLPFVRTSVDHGTAKEIFGKNRAEPGSMQDALATSIKLCQTQRSI